MASKFAVYLHELLDHGEYKWDEKQIDSLRRFISDEHTVAGEEEFITDALFRAIESGEYSTDHFRMAMYVYARALEWLIFPLSVGGE